MELGTGVGDRARAGLSTGVGLARAGGAYLHQRFVARDSRIDVRTARELIRLVAGLRGTSVKALQLLAMERDLFTPAAAAEIERACFGLPPIATYVVTSLLRGELGSGWRGKLVAFERQPFAAASIGQVHRGRLADGRAAAVKIQYPGIRARIDSDLGTLGRLLRFAEQPHYYRALLAELRVRLRQECDYRVEARHLGLFHRYGSADGIDVPEVVGEASTDVVLTTSMADGEHVSAWLDTGPDRAARDRAANALQGFHVRTLYGHGLLHADANPGNFLFRAGGDVTVLDFGNVRALDAADIAALRRTLTVFASGEQPSLARLGEVGLLQGIERERAEALRDEYIAPFRRWLSITMATDGFDFGAHPDHAAEGRERFLHLCRGGAHVGLHPALLLVGRTMFGLYRLYQRLGARVALRIPPPEEST